MFQVVRISRRGGNISVKASFVHSLRKILRDFLYFIHYIEPRTCFADKTAGVRICPFPNEKGVQPHTFFIWRRRGDSNSRCRSPHTNDLANRPLQPLGYSSSSELTLLSSWLVFILALLAEREGFEPSVRFTARRFSRPVPSTTRPPLHIVLLYIIRLTPVGRVVDD